MSEVVVRHPITYTMFASIMAPAYKYLVEAGYDESQVDFGIGEAWLRKAQTLDEVAQIAVSLITLDPDDYRNGARVAWEPVDWEEVG